MMRTPSVSLAALLVTAGVIAPAGAGPISGSFEGDSIFTPTAIPGVLAQTYTGEGTDTTFGSFTVQSNSIVDFSSPPAISVNNGTLTETFAEGTLFGTFSGEGTTSGTGIGTATAEWVFTGGTGLFTDATGEGTVLQTIVKTGPTTASGSATYTGTLSLVPEPGSLALLATAVFLFYRRRTIFRDILAPLFGRLRAVKGQSHMTDAAHNQHSKTRRPHRNNRAQPFVARPSRSVALR